MLNWRRLTSRNVFVKKEEYALRTTQLRYMFNFLNIVMNIATLNQRWLYGANARLRFLKGRFDGTDFAGTDERGYEYKEDEQACRFGPPYYGNGFFMDDLGSLELKNPIFHSSMGVDWTRDG
ncbi:hypothetical protein HPP92_022261 [Vanilla planifolia]|uniref:Uncharacterized protein n=1 Tax=Vanilla planifolia TaxID=51239 RepID=A0A835UBR7_VANPL|nr:hypothetical protein HPP92_022261 [Vanilla planifolia]